MGEFLVILVAAAFIISCGGQVQSDVSDHRYKAGDLIPCYARGTGPFHNPRYMSQSLHQGILIALIYLICTHNIFVLHVCRSFVLYVLNLDP